MIDAILREIFGNAWQGLNNENEILACVMLDRSVDFLTMFCSDFVYEGLLNEIFNSLKNEENKDEDKDYLSIYLSLINNLEKSFLKTNLSL